MVRRMYGKMMSIYKAQVASATTASDFVAIWLCLFSAYGIPFVVIGINKLFGLYEIYDLWEYMADMLFLLLLLLPVLVCHVFRDADVRFWTPRVFLSKKHSDEINIEKIKEIHTDEVCTLMVSTCLLISTMTFAGALFIFSTSWIVGAIFI